MKNNTELVFITDRSGSMGGLEDDTIGGINSVLAKNRALEGACNVSIVLFDHETDVIVDRVPIETVVDLDRDSYYVRGCTALLDALGGSIKHIERVQRYMPTEYKADHVIFVITTDGLENASHEFSHAQVKKMVEERTKDGWEFIFLGANIDAVGEAGKLGIREERAARYVADDRGSAVMYQAVGSLIASNRRCEIDFADASWKEEIEADTASRG